MQAANKIPLNPLLTMTNMYETVRSQSSAFWRTNEYEPDFVCSFMQNSCYRRSYVFFLHCFIAFKWNWCVCVCAYDWLFRSFCVCVFVCFRFLSFIFAAHLLIPRLENLILHYSKIKHIHTSDDIKGRRIRFFKHHFSIYGCLFISFIFFFLWIWPVSSSLPFFLLMLLLLLNY